MGAVKVIVQNVGEKEARLKESTNFLQQGQVYAKILILLKKLDKRSKSYKFVGYAATEYRLWDEEKRKVKIKRDVKFEEQNRKYFQNIKYDKTINLLDSEKEEEEEEETKDKEEKTKR